ncbi:MAG: hypothetical protein WDO15_03845 [Bacteroidota bacterium]
MKISLFSLVALLLLANCGGSGNNPQPSNNGRDITISSVTQHAYFDDTFTIQGTGFNSDMTKDTVALGYLNYNQSTKDSVFVSFTGKDINQVAQQPVILSATETEIKFKLSDPVYFQNRSITVPPHTPVVQVSSGGSKAVFHGINIKKIFNVSFSLVGGPNTPIRIDEPFYVAVTSPTSLCTMQALVNDCINGCTPGDFNKCQCEPGHNIDLKCQTTQIDANGAFMMTITQSEIPNSNQPCTNATSYQARFKFTNGDGKVFETSAWMWACKN